MKTSSLILATALALSAFVSGYAQTPSGGGHEAYGPKFKLAAGVPGKKKAPKKGLDTVRRWNQIAIDASGLDHSPVPPGDPRVFGEGLGPGRSSRAMAIVHIAMFDAVNAVIGQYENYAYILPKTKSEDKVYTVKHADLRAAVSQAAHDTLVAMYPSQAASFRTYLAEDLAKVKNKKEKATGIALGKVVAEAILTMRTEDGAEKPEIRVGVDGHPTSDLPGRWRQDPISLIPLALGAKWSECIPFALDSVDQFRTPPPPAMDSPEYAAAYDEVKRLGGDGIITPTERTPEQTEIGIYWAYDGVPHLCAPPRLYNQIATTIADQMESDGVEVARLLALVNIAMADAGMTSWDSKYYWDVWRPITGIRESDAGTGPTGLGDGNAATVGDPTFTPLGAPASNLTGPNFTPPFPAYPSGHATFGGALFQVLRRFYGTDDIPFTFVSDEMNGVTKANDGTVRPMVPRSFSNLSQAEEENGQSRIYLGIHWSFDKTEGIIQGRKVADVVVDTIYAPLPGKVKSH